MLVALVTMQAASSIHRWSPTTIQFHVHLRGPIQCTFLCIHTRYGVVYYGYELYLYVRWWYSMAQVRPRKG